MSHQKPNVTAPVLDPTGMNSEDAMRRRCGFGLLYEVSKSKKKNAPDDAFFLERIEHIRAGRAKVVAPSSVKR